MTWAQPIAHLYSGCRLVMGRSSDHRPASMCSASWCEAIIPSLRKLFSAHAGPALDDVQFCKDLLEEEHVAVSPGSAFGDVSDGFVRVSLARDVADVVEGLERLCRRIARVRADT